MTRPMRVRDDTWDNEFNSNTENDYDTDSCMDYGTNAKHAYDFKFKVCVLGETGVGKTALIKRFISNKFHDPLVLDYNSNNPSDDTDLSQIKPTIGVDCMTTVRIMRGHKIAIEVWDTAGQGKFTYA
jgi:GTPase SAR1 family protein